MTHTITVRGRTYSVVNEPRLNGEIAPHIYNSRGEVVGMLCEYAFGGATIVGTPKSWTRSDVRSAVRQILPDPDLTYCLCRYTRVYWG